MRFRPCIDLHSGKVKQIVGSTLRDEDPQAVKENFVAQHPPAWFARLFRDDQLTGGHVIMLGPGNEEAAREALAAWPGGLQVGGGITAENAGDWLDAGASHVIVTSYVFRDGKVDQGRLERLVKAVGRRRLVLDLSCRRKDGRYFIVTDRWQRFTEVEVSPATLEHLARFCDEFLVHGVDVEGRCSGIEAELVELLARHSPIPTTYAGGVKDLDDFLSVEQLGMGRIDCTVGSALDIFGGSTIRYRELVALSHRLSGQSPIDDTLE